MDQLMLHLGEGFDVPAPVTEGKGWTIVGKTGSGKTNTLLILSRELILAGWTVVIVDPMNAYRALRTAGLPVMVAGERESASIKINAENAAAVADFTFDQRVSTILSVSFDSDGMAVLQPYLERLWDRIYRQPEDGPFAPMALLIDEARFYVPQNGVTPVTKVLNKMRLLGRQLHLSMAAATQRPANVDKTFITQANVMIFHMMRGIDVSVVKDDIGTSEKDARAIIKKFQKGQAIVVGDADMVATGEEDYRIVQMRSWEVELMTPLPAVSTSPMRPIDEAALARLNESFCTSTESDPEVVDSGVIEALRTENTELLGKNERLQSDLKAKQAEIERLQSISLTAIKQDEVVVTERTTTTERTVEHRSSRALTMAINRQNRGFER